MNPEFSNTTNMIKYALSALFFLLFLSGNVFGQTAHRPVIVLHGGAGTIERSLLSDSLEKVIRKDLKDALEAGYRVLDSGGAAVDAVVTTIQYLENCPEFNAGKGAVMTDIGTHELDASIMNGSDLNAGAVAGVQTIKSPILAAREVMLYSPHVMLDGAGAEVFAKERGLEMVPNSYFTTKRIQKMWDESHNNSGSISTKKEIKKYGTVGCVALDKDGNIAAGTSTGGIMNKKFGRIGDSPIIGAGTYADNTTCGISCTGQGEYYIRIGVAKEISDQMKFGNKTLKEAVEYTLNKVSSMDALGGVISIDKDGNFELLFNTPGMYRAYKTPEKEKVMIYGDE